MMVQFICVFIAIPDFRSKNQVLEETARQHGMHGPVLSGSTELALPIRCPSASNGPAAAPKIMPAGPGHGKHISAIEVL